MQQFSPAPRIIAVRNADLVEYVRDQRDGCCLYHLYRNIPCQDHGLDPHHIDSKGSGGDDELENLITLCRGAHNLAHTGEVAKDELRQILTLYFGYAYEEAP